MNRQQTPETPLRYSPHFKRLHYQEVETLLNILAKLSLTEYERAVQAKLEEIRAAMKRKRAIEDALAASAVKSAEMSGSGTFRIHQLGHLRSPSSNGGAK